MVGLNSQALIRAQERTIMANDRSLEQIDVSKLVLYTLVFIALCAILIIFLVIPILKDYKNALNELSTQTHINKLINEDFQASLNRLEHLKSDNKALLEQFDADFNATHLLKFLGKYFEEVDLVEIKNNDAKQEYLQYEFNLSAILDNPKQFYSFIDALNTYQSLIRLESPVDLSSRDDGEIDINFMLKVYSSRSR